MRKDTVKTRIKLFCGLLLLIMSNLATAQSYITDKVVVAVYELPNSDSTLLRVLPTGTPLEIIGKQDDFSEIRTPDGNTGWVENVYITESKPAQLVVLEMTDKQKLVEIELNDSRKQILDMQERIASLQNSTGQVDNTELDKLKNTNRSLRNQLGDMEQELKKAQEGLQASTAHQQALEKEVADLREAVNKTAEDKPEKEVTSAVANDSSLAQLQTENAAMQKQLDAVYAALSMQAPSASDSNSTEQGDGITLGIGWLATWLVLLLIAGIVLGWVWFDRMHLKRHGGFRL